MSPPGAVRPEWAASPANSASKGTRTSVSDPRAMWSVEARAVRDVVDGEDDDAGQRDLDEAVESAHVERLLIAVAHVVARHRGLHGQTYVSPSWDISDTGTIRLASRGSVAVAGGATGANHRVTAEGP